MNASDTETMLVLLRTYTRAVEEETKKIVQGKQGGKNERLTLKRLLKQILGRNPADEEIGFVRMENLTLNKKG